MTKPLSPKNENPWRHFRYRPPLQVFTSLQSDQTTPRTRTTMRLSTFSIPFFVALCPMLAFSGEQSAGHEMCAAERTSILDTACHEHLAGPCIEFCKEHSCDKTHHFHHCLTENWKATNPDLNQRFTLTFMR